MYNHLSTATTRINALLCDFGINTPNGWGGAMLLRELVKVLDVNGRGWAELSISGTAEFFNRSKTTVKRWLGLIQGGALKWGGHSKSGIELGIFRHVQVLSRDRVKVFYSSRNVICCIAGLDHWGVTAEVPLSEVKNLKTVATEVQTSGMQRSSIWAAKQDLAKKDRGRVVRSIDVLTTSQNSCRNSSDGKPVKKPRSKKVLYIGKRYAFLNDSAVLSGVSQVGVAKVQGRSDRTIRNRLNNQWRSDRGIEAIHKKQLALTKPEFVEIGFEITSIFGAIEFPSFFNSCGRTFQAGCNIYEERFSLKSCKIARVWFQRKRGSIETKACKLLGRINKGSE